ncbi:DUF6883 domain-containing protein [Leptolyngbya sp. NIES-2104]|uniref:DUF6883 domain-containing protein n=1 Tax=Leptolyngbya sp. NIES-2104 TaxID=1552121 RepID=UPI0006EC5C05|nr:DUF6883 domain-containing protein [Leptolyngbya sp. NIES-2104]GAP95957.1 hypothetical protein NIES2104_24860 [Leptolyngbya sp. NIES-2104]
MKMPSGLVIQERKLTNYLLIYQPKDDESEFLAGAGYTLQTWRSLEQDILRAVEGHEVFETIATEWGTRFRVNCEWTGLNGRRLRVVTIWQQDTGADAIRFVTLYPDKSEEENAGQEDCRMKDVLFHWVVMLRDVPESGVKVGDRGVIVDELPFSEEHQETGYTIEVFRQGETVAVVSVPVSWGNVLPEVWGQKDVSAIAAS